MANSSYDWLFAKPALKWLFNDYIDNNAHALLRLSPGEDPRVSITARFHSSLRANKHRNIIVAEQNSGVSMHHCITYVTTPQALCCMMIIKQLSGCKHWVTETYVLVLTAGSMTLRYQVDPAEPLTFLDVKVGKQVRIRPRTVNAKRTQHLDLS